MIQYAGMDERKEADRFIMLTVVVHDLKKSQFQLFKKNPEYE